MGQVHNSVLVITDKAIKWGYFVLYREEISAKNLSEIYIKETFVRHGALVKIILDQNPKFVLEFWQIFTAK